VKEMKKEKVFVRVFLFVAMTRFFFGTPGLFASHESILNGHAAGQTEAEELLTFRIGEVIERRSPSRCEADPKMVSNERKLDPQLLACDTIKNLVLLIQNESTITEDSMPMNC
jgi:hypothetical protein